MAEFIKVGRLLVAVSEVKAVQKDEDGKVTLHYGNTHHDLSQCDGCAAYDWAEANLVGECKKAAKAEEDRAEAERKQAEKEAERAAKEQAKEAEAARKEAEKQAPPHVTHGHAHHEKKGK